jgi:hypothetical protein
VNSPKTSAGKTGGLTVRFLPAHRHGPLFRQTAARLVVLEDAQLANRPHTRRSGLARLFPIKHKNALGPALTHQAFGHRQGREICRKLDLPGARNFAFQLVCDFQTALVHAAA